MKVSVNVDSEFYLEKPEKIIPKIKHRTSQLWQEIELEELADLIGNKGHAMVPGKLVEDVYMIKLILMILHKIFPECDVSCKNLDRLFLGGKKLIYLNKNAHITLVQLLSPFYQSMSVGA